MRVGSYKFAIVMVVVFMAATAVGLMWINQSSVARTAQYAMKHARAQVAAERCLSLEKCTDRSAVVKKDVEIVREQKTKLWLDGAFVPKDAPEINEFLCEAQYEYDPNEGTCLLQYDDGSD